MYNPPPGPPPNRPATPSEPPPYHDWQAIPDTARLPPPPSISHDYSPTANATKDESDRAAIWCRQYPLWTARLLTPDQLQAIRSQNFVPVNPPSYIGDLISNVSTAGTWKCRTSSSCPDSLLQTTLPIYSALSDSPLITKRSKTIYFEAKILGMGRSHHYLHHKRQDEIDSGVAIGFFAPPYPSFRLPGWQRGSLAVHSDDGRRYVADTHGGIDFTEPFKPGQTLGLGMTFQIPDKPPAYGEQGHSLDVEVFFTRDGKRVGGWDLHEERDELDQDVRGLEGECDLFPAIGVFGGCDLEVRFHERDWMYRPK